MPAWAAPFLFQNTRVKILARETGAGAYPEALPAEVRREGLLRPGPLRSAMREAGHWDEDEVRRRESAGDACHLVVEGGRCVHYSWTSRRRIYISEVGFRADLGGGAGGLWVYNAYTAPGHRGRSLFPRVLAGIARGAAGDGIPVVWAGVLEENASSFRGLLKAGFVESAVLERTALFGAVGLRRGRIPVDARLSARLDRLAGSWN